MNKDEQPGLGELVEEGVVAAVGLGLSQGEEQARQTDVTGGVSLLLFVYLLYQFRLAFSGWRYARVVQGGESYPALSEGLQAPRPARQ